MTDLPIWAQDKAREWLVKSGGPLEGPGVPDEYGWVPIADYSIASLAALLVETRDCLECRKGERARVLAEVRRVVAALKVEYTSGTSGCADACLCCDEILARLAKLDTPRLSTEDEAKAAMGDNQPLTKVREIG